ncbi:ABC transporter substrate-binding protein [Actinomadura rugatobispora]|uniref:ABC transporter substrate-binding protein n=1 Tax=Actinomadura rugatobispora TaxID=1994 RepID=A0ABW1A8L9_9ACTN|nr:ABC transporter substrate-binding protein [Actinomadura rugatobispora]
MRAPRILVAAVAAMTMAAGTACGPGTDASAPSGTGPGGKPFKIDVLLGLSGDYAPVGKVMAQGARAAASVINQQGGVFGKPVELNVIDTAGDPVQAVTQTRKLVADGRPQAVVPGMVTADIMATAPLLAQAKVFMATHGPDPRLNDPKKYPYLFGTTYLRDQMATSLAAEFTAKGFKKVSLITAEKSGSVGAQTIKDVLGTKGITTNIVTVPVAAVDATSQMQQALDLDPDVLVLDSYGPPSAAIVQARTKLKPDVPTYASQNFSSGDLSENGPASAYDGVRLQSLSFAVKGHPTTQTQAFKAFFDATRQQTGGTLEFSMNTYVVTYNDVILAAYAAKLANSTDPAKMTAAIEKAGPAQIPYFLGPVNFSSSNHYPSFGPEWWAFAGYKGMDNSQIVPATP